MKNIISLFLSLIMTVTIIPSTVLNVFAWDEYIECEFCGAGCGDEYICSCGDHCSEESGRDCYYEHHCSECNDVAELCGGTDGCGKCYDCGGYCSAGDSHQFLECHLVYNLACPDCGQCWNDEDTICKECLGCVECIGRCEGGDHLLCIECHDDTDICPDCDACYIESDLNSCDSCYTCEYCVFICPECNLCENCVQICENCEEICVECHEADGETCPECGFCYFGEIYCLDCGICYNCEYICPDCELCCVCYDDYHCVECDECFEVNGQCETGGAHCAVCCENNDWLCPECGECIEVSGATVCRDCGACENCTEICTICGDYCIECAQFEERLHCGKCGECFEGNALMHCADCYLCENCTEMCPECWDYCVDCGVKSEMHCPDCKGCYYIYDDCVECGRCSNCIDYCPECEMCSECAIDNDAHCRDCGNCSYIYYTCPDCVLCEECLGEEFCYACGGCNTCIATDVRYKNRFHCAECYQCFDEIERCEECEYCVDCCKCLFLSTVTFDANGGSGTMSPENVFGVYMLPSCGFTPPISTLPTLPPTTVKWTFIGWKIGNSIYNAGDIVIINADTTVTAMWTQVQPLSYTVVYNGNGGRGTMTPKTGVSGSFILPNCEYTAPTGKQFKAYYVNGIYYQPGDVIDVKANTVVWIYWKNAPADVISGVTVSGMVTSFGEESEKTTVELFPSGSETPAFSVTLTGTHAMYSFNGVEAGTYIMKVSKANHVTREYTVVVGNSSIPLDAKIYLKGDVNGDGKVNMFDYVAVKSHVLGKSLLSGDKLERADVNGDSKVNMFDYIALKNMVVKG